VCGLVEGGTLAEARENILEEESGNQRPGREPKSPLRPASGKHHRTSYRLDAVVDFVSLEVP
jgi:hypothetical protein